MTRNSNKLNPGKDDEITAGTKKAFDRMLMRDVRKIDGKKLSPLDKLVGIYLSDMCMDGRDRSWPSYRLIASECGCSERAAKSSVKMLGKSQYIRIQHRFNDGDQSSNMYFPAYHLLNEQDAGSSAPVQSLHPTGERIAPPLVKSLHPGDAKFALKTPDGDPLVDTPDLKQTPAALASELTGHVLNSSPASQPQAGNDNWPVDAMDQFWEQYPYQDYRYDQLDRNGRSPDEGEDFRLSKIELRRLRDQSVPFEAVISSVVRYSDRIREKGIEYILSPQKWLRNGHWEDDYSFSLNAA